MTIWCIYFKAFVMLLVGVLRHLRGFIECSWISPRAPTVMVMSVLTFQSINLSICMSGSYLLCFYFLFINFFSLVGNLSWS